MKKFYILSLLLFLNYYVIAQSPLEKESKSQYRQSDVSTIKSILMGVALATGILSDSGTKTPLRIALKEEILKQKRIEGSDDGDPIDQELKSRQRLILLLGLNILEQPLIFLATMPAINTAISAFATASVPTQISVVYYGFKAGKLVKPYFYPSAQQRLQMLLKYESSEPSFEEKLRRVSHKKEPKMLNKEA